MKIVFMGTPEIARTILQGLIGSKHDVECVVTQPDRAKNRGKKIQYTPVKELALENNIKVLQPEKVKGNDEFYEELCQINPDIIVVAAYGKILTKEILELPKYGCINVHASLLPLLRGAAPIQWAILEGFEKTGVTIMQMAEGMDTGDMLTKAEINIGTMNSDQLYEELSKLGSQLLLRTLDDIEKGKVSPVKQDEKLATYTQKITKSDGKIDFNMEPVMLARRAKAFDSWPGLFCNYGHTVMKVWNIEPDNNEYPGQNGEILEVQKDRFLVKAGGKGIWVTEIQMPGKKRVQVAEYLKGNSIEKGAILK